jgi:hypothetical protein
VAHLCDARREDQGRSAACESNTTRIEYAKAIAAQGLGVAGGSSAEDFAKFVEGEKERDAVIANSSGVQPE